MSRPRLLAALAAAATLPFLATPAAASGVCVQGGLATGTGTVTVCRGVTSDVTIGGGDTLKDTVCAILASHEPEPKPLYHLYCFGDMTGFDICLALMDPDEVDVDPYRDKLAEVCAPLAEICKELKPVCDLLPPLPPSMQGTVLDLFGVVVVEVSSGAGDG